MIRAFNANKPFDRFTIEQLAGDLLAGADRRDAHRLGLQPPAPDDPGGRGAGQGIHGQVRGRPRAQRVDGLAGQRRWAAPSATTTSSTRSRPANSTAWPRSSPTSRKRPWASRSRPGSRTAEQAEALEPIEREIAPLKAIKKPTRSRAAASWPSSRSGRKRSLAADSDLAGLDVGRAAGHPRAAARQLAGRIGPGRAARRAGLPARRWRSRTAGRRGSTWRGGWSPRDNPLVGPRDGQPALETGLRPGAGHDARRLRLAGGLAHPSRAARLAGV